MFSPTPVSTPAAVQYTLTDEEEATLAEALEGGDSLEDLLERLLDLGDKEWEASRRTARRPVPQAGN